MQSLLMRAPEGPRVVQKAFAIADRFAQLSAGNDSEVLFPEQLMQVRMGENFDTGEQVCTMARYFVERVFEVHVRGACPVTGKPGMTLPEFADFLLAWNFRGGKASDRCSCRCWSCAAATRCWTRCSVAPLSAHIPLR